MNPISAPEGGFSVQDWRQFVPENFSCQKFLYPGIFDAADATTPDYKPIKGRDCQSCLENKVFQEIEHSHRI